jgi:hypothetical protein
MLSTLDDLAAGAVDLQFPFAAVGSRDGHIVANAVALAINFRIDNFTVGMLFGDSDRLRQRRPRAANIIRLKPG